MKSQDEINDMILRVVEGLTEHQGRLIDSVGKLANTVKWLTEELEKLKYESSKN